MLGPTVVGAAPGEDARSTENPDLERSCGIDIHVVLDESASIGTARATESVREAFRGFTNALRNTGSRLAVSEFSTVARLPLSGPAQRAYTEVTDETIDTTFEPYIEENFNPSGRTNWEDALRMGRYFLPRPSPDVPHLTVFITDGDPNEVIRADRVPHDPGNPNEAQNPYGLRVPLPDNHTQSANASTATSVAVPNANAVRAQGSHVLAVAVGSALDNQASLNRLKEVSGPHVFDGTGTFDITTHDVYRVDEFAELEEALRLAAFDLCAPSVTVRKMIDQDADPEVQDLLPGAGWDLTATVEPAPASWILPPTAAGAAAAATTSAAGFATFQWTPADTGPAEIVVTESDGPDPGFAFLPAGTECTFRTQDSPDDQELETEERDNGFATVVPHESIVTCTIVNEAVPDPGITLEKYTNGATADEPPGPYVPVGEEVTWTYVVTNSGNVTLSGIDVSDDQEVTVECPRDSLPAGETMTCTATGESTAGQYTNMGSVTATDPFGTTHTDDDVSHYLGTEPGIAVLKRTNGDPTDEVPGPFIPVGDEVTWDYEVVNTGNVPLSDVTLTDDQEGVEPVHTAGDENGDGLLDVTETWTYTATGTAAAGQYENVASASGVDTQTGATVQDSNASHYFGENPTITLQKLTNGEDVAGPPGPSVPTDSPVTWTYRMTNTGNVPLTWSLTDDLVDVIACPLIRTLVPGHSIFCQATGTAQPGPYTNLGTVVGTSPSGETTTDTDPSHHFGVTGAIEIEKLTNGEAAGLPPGPVIAVGGPVQWSYVVTNTGNGELTDIAVEDDRGAAVTCPATTLAAGASMTCAATGVAGAGQYTNHATVTGVTELGGVVQDVDLSNHFGDEPGLHLVKLTNGVDANEAPGAFIPVGDEVTWTYVVTNTGNSTLTAIAVSDDQGLTVTCPSTSLAPGEDMTCEATGTAEEGPYTNIGTATATGAQGTLTATDPSHYFGSVSTIDVVKRTNGEDGDDVAVTVGDPVTWTYEVSNAGNIAILDPQLTDDQGVVPTLVGGDTDDDGQLDPGETWTYEATGTAVADQYRNVATVSALDVLENPLTATDASGYVGTEQPAPPSPEPPDAAPQPQPPTSPPDLPQTGWAPLAYVTTAVALLALGAVLALTVRSARRSGGV